MNRFRFSLAALVGFVALSAAVLGALRATSGIGSGTVFTLAIGVFSAAILGTVYNRGEDRAFWLGVAVFGWGFMLLTHGPWFDNHIAHLLLGNQIALYIHPKLLREVPTPPGDFSGTLTTSIGPEFFDVSLTCQSIMALLASLVGGSVVCYFHRRHMTRAN